MDEYFELVAIPEFRNVICPKHRNYMKQLNNGLLGKKLWYCKDCDRPYFLKPTMMKEKEFDRAELDRQVNPTQSDQLNKEDKV